METALPRPNHTFFFSFFFTGKETSYCFAFNAEEGMGDLEFVRSIC